MSDSRLEARYEGPPTQDFTTAGLLMDCTDCKVSLTLRDGEVILGVLRSYDEFGSLVIQDAFERIYHNKCYGQRFLGTWIVRGENVALLGKIDPEQEAENENYLKENWTQMSFEEIEKTLSEDRKAFETKKQEQAQQGLKKGLVGSTLTGNPYRFGLNT